MPYQTATNPDTGEKVINVDGAWKPLESSATHPDSGEKAYKVGGKWLTGEPAAAKPPAATDNKQDQSDDKESSTLENVAGAYVEPAAHVASEMLAAPAAGVASLYKLATAPWGKKASEASKAAQSTQQAMTYQPRTDAGKAISGAADSVLGLVGKGADAATDGIAENETVKKVIGAEGAKYLQAGSNAALQAIPALLGLKGAKVAAVAPEAAAETFVKSKTGLDWDSMPKGVKEQLTQLAKDDPKALDRIKPAAVERQARFEENNVPATKGQMERNKTQLTKEENQQKDSNSNVAKIHDAQDERFHQILDEEVKKIGPSPAADTRGGVGDSVQGAAREKAAGAKTGYDKDFETARNTEPNAQVSASPLRDLLQKSPHLQNLDFVKSWLAKAKLEVEIPGTKGKPGTPASKSTYPDGTPVVRAKPGTPGTPSITAYKGVTLNDLFDLRTDATAIAKKGGKEGYYASQVARVIDKSMEEVPAAAKNWRKAIDSYKAYKTEFKDQGRVAALVENKRSAKGDPRIAREDTFQHSIVTGSAKNVSQIKQTLTTGGAKGVQAWKDLQAETLRYLQEKASGKREIQGETGSRQFNSSFLDHFNELDKDGKIDVIFDKPTATRLRGVAKMVHDARTKPGKGTSGSDSVPRFMALTQGEKMSLIPGGQYIRAVGNAIESVHGRAMKGKENAKAKLSDLAESAHKAGKEAKSKIRKAYTLRGYAAGAAGQPQPKDDDE